MAATLLRLAIGMLERLGVGGYSESLCGDLLEELARSGPTGRLWRDVGAGFAAGLWRRGRGWIRPMMFAAGWSAMYPIWRSVEALLVPGSVAARAEMLEWPYSRVLELAVAGMPVLAYVWLGFLLYTVRNERLGSPVSWFYVLRGVLLAPSVLLVSTLLMHLQARAAGGPVWSLGVAGPAGREPMTTVWVPVALSLAAAMIAGRAPRTSLDRAGSA